MILNFNNNFIFLAKTEILNHLFMLLIF